MILVKYKKVANVLLSVKVTIVIFVIWCGAAYFFRNVLSSLDGWLRQANVTNDSDCSKLFFRNLLDSSKLVS